jgi:dTDP-4-dehydrorhamnose 3,5-epimerase
VKFIASDIPDVVIVETPTFEDDRGFFAETWHADKFAAGGIDATFVQDNHSRSIKHTLRGLHYQIEQAQGKLVRVVAGSVFDVAVDLRRASSTFGAWVGFVLSGENRRQAYIPPGFAHGFLVTSDYAEFVYKCTDYYAPQHERTIIWNDPHLNIEWPLRDEVTPRLSARDRGGVAFKDAPNYP